MEKLRTVDSILEWMYKQVSSKQIVSPYEYIQAAEMLNALIGDETDKLFLLEQKLAITRAEMLKDSNMPVSRVKVIVEASDTYREARMTKAKIDRVNEHIRIAKLQARMKNEEFINYK